MAGIEQLVKRYPFTTFKETSYDDTNKDSLCHDTTQRVLNFDEIIKKKYPDPYDRPKSFDALYIQQHRIYLIEFKNQPPKFIDNTEVQLKLQKGKEELDKFLAQENIQKKEYEFIYCVVHKKTKKTIFDDYKTGISESAVRFGLEKYTPKYAHKIITKDVETLTKHLEKKIQKNLKCKGY